MIDHRVVVNECKIYGLDVESLKILNTLVKAKVRYVYGLFRFDSIR